MVYNKTFAIKSCSSRNISRFQIYFTSQKLPGNILASIITTCHKGYQFVTVTKITFMTHERPGLRIKKKIWCTVLHLGLYKYLTAQDTHVTSTLTKYKQTLVRLGVYLKNHNKL